MKRSIFSFLAFPVALLSGIFFSAALIIQKPLEVPSNILEVSEAEKVIAESCLEECAEFKTEFLNLANWEEIEYPDTLEKVLDYFEVDASNNHVKTGERMLVFANENGRLLLKNSRTKLEKRTTEHGERMFDISFDVPGEPILAFRKFDALRERKIETVFVQEYFVEYEDKRGKLDAGFSRSFSLSGTDYLLRVSSGQRKNGELAGVLVLSTNETLQLVYIGAHWPDVGPALGDLVWAGDMDGDNKLDLLVNHNSGEEGAGSSLFLSSQAEPGHLVKLSAVFGGGGC